MSTIAETMASISHAMAQIHRAITPHAGAWSWTEGSLADSLCDIEGDLWSLADAVEQDIENYYFPVVTQ